jgi:hypothetical protein
VKRKLAMVWAALCGLTVAFLVIVWFTLPTGDSFWAMAKAATVGVTLMMPAVRYLQRTPADREKLRELRDIDRKLDQIDGRN